MYTRIKQWDKDEVHRTFFSFAPNTHTLNFLKQSINIVFILKKTQSSIIVYIMNETIKLYNYTLFCLFDIFC